MAEVTIAAEAAHLVTTLQVQLQPTLQQQAREPNPPPSLQHTLMKTFEKNADDFLPLKENFTKYPGAILEKIVREGGPQWRKPQFVDMMATENTRHLSLTLNPCKKDFDLNDVETDLTCDKIVERCNGSLRSLQIHCLSCPHKKYWKGKMEDYEYHRPGLSLAQLCGVLRRLKNVTELDLRAMHRTSHSKNAFDMIISHLALNNPHVEIIYLPFLTVESRTTIMTRWPKFKILHAYDTSFDFGDLEKMENLVDEDFHIKTSIVLALARAYDPATNSPYKQGGSLDCSCLYLWNNIAQSKNTAASDSTDTSSNSTDGPSIHPVRQDMINIFTAFPNLESLQTCDMHVSDLCASLEGRENVHITKLQVDDALDRAPALSPLLAIIGHDLRELTIFDDWSVVDLAMIGHYCPNLENLWLNVYDLEAAEEYEVTDTAFSHLKDLHMEVWVEGGARLPNPLLCRLLGGPLLEVVNVDGLVIPQEVIESLMMSAEQEEEEEEQRSLMSMKELIVHHRLTNTATFAGLLARMPRLTELVLKFIDIYDGRTETVASMAFYRKFDVLTEFSSQSGLKARIFQSDTPWA